MKEAVKAGKLLKDFTLTKAQCTDLMKSMDNKTDDIMDETVHIVDEVFTEYLNDETCNMKLFGILETLGNKSSGFTYALCNDGDGKLSGFVWMTSVMRSNFEKYS